MMILRMERHNANSDKVWLTALSICPFEIAVFAQFVKTMVAFRKTRTSLLSRSKCASLSLIRNQMNPCYTLKNFSFKVNFNIFLYYALSILISSLHLMPKTTSLSAFLIFAISGGLGTLFKLQILRMSKQSHDKSVIKFTPYFEYYRLYGAWWCVVWYRGRYELATSIFRVTFHL